ILYTIKINETQCLTTINPSLYYHLVLRSAIPEHFKFISSNSIDVIKIVIGNEGLPISKINVNQLWSILSYIRIQGLLNVRIPSSVVKIISDQLASFKKGVPYENPGP
ncbi:Uncharacterized protein FWK35_00037430, partial [Aphis craccivora]